jgi:pimeloyl-ACP methyl ester carboxylesterase
MAAALHHPSTVDSLMVVDMSPQTGIAVDDGTDGGVGQVGRAMAAMPADAMRSKEAADAFLATLIETPMIRQWMLQNLVIPKAGEPHWRLNLDALIPALGSAALLDLDASGLSFGGPTVFLRGSRSSRVDERVHGPVIRQLFPQAIIRSLDTGHWVHSEKPKEFIDEVLRFVNDS